MKRSRAILAAIFSALFALASGAASGVEVYKWAGPDGVTHYAEAPPESTLASLEVVNLIVTEPASPAVADYQSVLDVANSIQASRLERERVRIEREKLLLQERQLQQSQLFAQQRYYENYAGTNVYYLPYSRHQPHHKPYPHRYGTPHNNGGQPHRGSVPGRVTLSR